LFNKKPSEIGLVFLYSPLLLIYYIVAGIIFGALEVLRGFFRALSILKGDG